MDIVPVVVAAVVALAGGAVLGFLARGVWASQSIKDAAAVTRALRPLRRHAPRLRPQDPLRPKARRSLSQLNRQTVSKYMNRS